MPAKAISNKDLEKLGIKKTNVEKPNNSTQVSRLINSQISATNDLVDVAKKAIDNPQLNLLIKLLSEQMRDKPNTDKRLVINRDKKGLINSIDIRELN